MQENEQIGKRVNLDSNNIKKLKILTALFENETIGLNEKKKLDYIINKAIGNFYSSSEVKKMLEI